MSQYDALIEAALADVEAGNQHPCGTTDDCRKMVSGCPKCFGAFMRSEDIGVTSVDVFPASSVIRLTLSENHNGQRCRLAFKGVPVTIHE